MDKNQLVELASAQPLLSDLLADLLGCDKANAITKLATGYQLHIDHQQTHNQSGLPLNLLLACLGSL